MKIILKILSGNKSSSIIKKSFGKNNSSLNLINQEKDEEYEPMDVTDCDRIDEINAKNHNNNNNNNNSKIENKDKNLSMTDTKETMNFNLKSETDDEYENLMISKKDTMNVVEECNLVESSQRNRMRIALGVLIRLVLPLCNGVARGWRGIRGVRLLKALKNLGASRHMLTNMLAYAANTISMSLSSVQVAYRIDPILKIMKLKKGSATKSIAANSSSVLPSPNKSELRVSALTEFTDEPEKSVTIDILAEPPPGTPIRADIVFIHGLHGSLVNTWKQGLWNSEGRKENFKRPPKPPLRPPKRPRHSRSSIIIPPQLQKRARYAGSDSSSVYDSYDSDSSDQESQTRPRQFSYDFDQPEFTSFCDDVEYSFPTFRLRREEYHNDSPLQSPSSSKIPSDFTAPSSPTPSDESMQDTEFQQQSSTPDSDTGTGTYSKCWPGDWLPLDCPGVRVIALNYTTDPYLWRPVWVKKRNRTSLTERAREMTEMLIEKRVGYGHPIVWVGHSKGGIFIKQIIVDAWESGRPAAAPLWRFSRGVFFYSVPHRGSPLADFNLPLLRQSIELTEIQKNSTFLLDLHRRFVALYQSGNLKIDVFSFVETALTLMSVLYLRIVGVDSADPGIGEVCGVHLDHRQICKPRNRNCTLYTELIKMINRIS